MSITASDVQGKRPRLLLICVVVFALALAIRLAYALSRPALVSADAAYYVMVAENLYHGRGFTADYVWNYLAGLPKGLPTPSNEYWMPGNSVVIWAAFAAARSVSLGAAQAPSILFGALLCAITAWIGWVLFHRRDTAVLAGAMAAISFHLVSLTASPDHFMLAGCLVNLSLLALWTAWRGSGKCWLVAGGLAGLAYLTRTDGALLVIVALVLAVSLFRTGERRRAAVGMLLFLAAFVGVAAPWWARQTVVFGNPSGASPVRTAFLTQYNDLFRLDQSRLNLRDYLAESQVVAAGVKGYVLYRELRLLAKVAGAAGLLALAALFVRAARREAAPWMIYCLLGLLAPGLLTPYPAMKGGFWHLLAGLCPAVFVLGAQGIVLVPDLARRGASPGKRWLGKVALAAAFAWLIGWWVFPPGEAEEEAAPLYPAVALDAVRALGPVPPAVLTDNAWGLYHVAHVPCAQFPTDGAEAALKVADAIGARYLITQADAPDQIPAMAKIVGDPRFQPLVRYPTSSAPLLVYLIVPAEGGPGRP